MARPTGYQWEPLGWDTDPVPGDPQVISAEAAHLTQVANEITSQVTALRQISADGVQIGQSPAAIRSAASTLADHLDKVVGRYEKVAAALRGWGPELEQAQRLSVQALNQAEVPYAKLRQQVILPTGSNLTAAQQQVASYHATRFSTVLARAGAAARIERAAAPDPAHGVDHGARHVDYAVLVPGSADRWLVFAFSALGAGDSGDEFAGILVGLFDAIMSTFRWTWSNEKTPE
jgi:hypothetical protein